MVQGIVLIPSLAEGKRKVCVCVCVWGGGGGQEASYGKLPGKAQ